MTDKKVNPSIKLLFLMLIAFVISNSIFLFNTHLLTYDIFGYYIYLPLTFLVDGNSEDALQYLNEIQLEYSVSESLYQIQGLKDGGFVLKYTSGWSVCYAPFFAIGHLIASNTHFSTNGFSAPYQLSIFIGSLIYLSLGIYFLFKVLLVFFKSSLSILLIALLVLGTNYLLHFTLHGQSAMTHNIIFTGYTLVLWLTIKWYSNRTLKNIVSLGIVCGLMLLIRPTEIFCLLIPLLWPYPENEKRIAFLKRYSKQILTFTVIIILIGCTQLIYWKINLSKGIFSKDPMTDHLIFNRPWCARLLPSLTMKQQFQLRS